MRRFTHSHARLSLHNIRSFFVRFQETPNEACYKFFVKDTVFLPHSGGTMLFDRTNDFQSPLARSILTALPMVEEVTIGPSFVTVRRVESDNAEVAAKYFAMKFHGSHNILTNPEDAANRSQALQRQVNEAMQEDEPSPAPEAGDKSIPKPSAEDSFELGGFQVEQDNTDDAINEEALRALIEATDWSDLKLHVSALITDHLHSGDPHVSPDAQHPHADTFPEEGDSEIVLMIKELIATSIRPQLQEDGGDIRFCRFDEESGIMEVEMLGACRTCKSSKTTLVDLIERTSRHWIPEVKGVKEVQRTSAFELFSSEQETEDQSEFSEEEEVKEASAITVDTSSQRTETDGTYVLREVNKAKLSQS